MENNVKPSDRDNKDGTKGFSPQLGGNGKAGSSNTSSFDAEEPTKTGNKTVTGKGQEEGGSMRQQTTSANGRVK